MPTNTIQTEINAASPNTLSDELRTVRLGDFIGYLAKKIAESSANNMGYTETDVVPVSHVATLAGVPTAILQVNAGTATVTGVKTLRRGPITGPSAITPATTECVWDGNLSVKFATADAVTKVSFLYMTAATSVCSLTSGTIQG